MDSWGRLVSELEHTLEPERQIRWIEVITGAGGRRLWIGDDKARILMETLEAGAVVSVAAQCHGLTPQRLFSWRREARKLSEETGPRLVPVVIEQLSRKQRKAQLGVASASNELEIGGVRLWTSDCPKASPVAVVTRALKASS